MVTKERLKELLNAESKLLALENGGVDNWEGYSFSLESYLKEKEEEEELIVLVETIIEICGDSAYEVSESGAGIAFADNIEDKIVDEIRTYIRKLKE
jgi:hypothetical protein